MPQGWRKPCSDERGECQDGNPCTTNTCEGNIAAGEGVCVSTGVPGCCQTDADCDDQNACTTDTCNQTTNTCVFTPIVCEDNDPCTLDTCDPATGCAHTEIPGCVACQTVGDCANASPAPNQCQQRACTDGICTIVNRPNGTGCNDNLACTRSDVCTDGVCAGTSTCTSGQNTQCCAAGTTSAGQCRRATGATCNNNNQCCNACVSGACT
jgi:hypothetical protein